MKLRLRTRLFSNVTAGWEKVDNGLAIRSIFVSCVLNVETFIVEFFNWIVTM